MSVLVVRHGLSWANDKNSAAFGSPDAELMPKGLEQGRMAGISLLEDHGVRPDLSAAAASAMLRSQQTARMAGFTTVNNYAVLNEVDLPKTPELRKLLDLGEIVQEAREAAERVLANPPRERVWFGHGYLIAALCDLTEIDTSKMRFIPRFGEIRELPI